MKYLNKSSGSIRLATLLFGAAVFGLVSQSAMAACTPGVNCTASGTVISNQATLAYSVGGVGQAGITSAAATFTVDNKVMLTVAKLADASILPNSTNQVLYFSVTNTGNTSQSYALTTTAGAFTATMTNVRIYNDNGGSGPGVYDGTNTLYVAGAATVAADATLKVLVVADQTAPTATNGQTAIYNLVAQTTDAGTANVTANASGAANTAGVDVVWADAAGSVDAATDGKHSASATYTVVITVPTVTKTATLLCDPIVGDTTATPHNIPGSITQWTITVTNPPANPNNVTLTTITDALVDVTKTAMDPGAAAGLNVPTAVAATCVAGAGPYGFKVTVPVARNLGGSAGGASATTSYFTTTTTADGIDFATPNITATFATILPIDAVNVHATAGLLKPNESVTIIFNTVLQ